MPWTGCSVMERPRFVAHLFEGEAMADLASEFGISRKTGYKILTLQGTRAASPMRPLQAALALCQPVAAPGRKPNRLPCVRAGQHLVRAGEGNRTLVISLEGCCSTIELH